MTRIPIRKALYIYRIPQNRGAVFVALPDYLKNTYKPIIIFHRHEDQTEYHKHAQVINLRFALSEIRKHDTYQINIRWRGFIGR